MTRSWPKHIVLDDSPFMAPAAEAIQFDVPPQVCTDCGGRLTPRGYCLACTPALCGGCGQRSCAVCGPAKP